MLKFCCACAFVNRGGVGKQLNILVYTPYTPVFRSFPPCLISARDEFQHTAKRPAITDKDTEISNRPLGCGVE
jgi:hypothetical protein